MDTGSTAWILTSTALVLFMTMPGLALFYGGLVKSENVLSVLMHCFGIACVASITWLGIGYSIAFTSGNPYFGDFSQIFLLNMARDSMSGDIPESVFFMFQMTFCIITPALIVGAYPERMKFQFVLLFSFLCLCSSYSLDMGRRMASRIRSFRLCRWPSCSLDSWNNCNHFSNYVWSSRRIPRSSQTASQSWINHDGSLYVMGRLVWF